MGRRIRLFPVLDDHLPPIGVGAILQVIVEVGRLIARSQARHQEPALTWTTLSGVTAGVAVMYLTALLVTA